jgi:acyl-CoA thioester hydrolase
MGAAGGSGPGPARPWPLAQRFVVTYHDVDALNHLNHAAYFPWMETLRCAYYLPLLGETDPRRLDIILAEAVCRFLAPAGYGTQMVGEVAPALPVGRSSFSLLYRFTSPEDPVRVYGRGRTVVVCYDYEKSEKKPIDPRIRARLEQDGILLESEGWSPR